MNYEELEIYTCQIMIPLKYRGYFFKEDWRKGEIPSEDAKDLIDYHRQLERLVLIDDPRLFRELIKKKPFIYGTELEHLLNLNNDELLLILKNIGIEKTSDNPHFSRI